MKIIALKSTVPALIATAALLVFSQGVPGLAPPAFAACEPGVHIDGTTAATAKRKMEAAGYQQVRGLKKGCDNVWHGSAVKDGAQVFVALSPEGRVMRDGE